MERYNAFFYHINVKSNQLKFQVITISIYQTLVPQSQFQTGPWYARSHFWYKENEDSISLLWILQMMLLFVMQKFIMFHYAITLMVCLLTVLGNWNSESEWLIVFISQIWGRNHNRNGGAHHYLGMENGRLIPTGEVGTSLPFSKLTILPSPKIENAHFVLFYN